MNRFSFLVFRYSRELLGIALVCGLGVLFQVLSPPASLDWLFVLRGPIASPQDTEIVFIDEIVPGDWNTFTKLLNVLKSARAVVFDIALTNTAWNQGAPCRVTADDIHLDGIPSFLNSLANSSNKTSAYFASKFSSETRQSIEGFSQGNANLLRLRDLLANDLSKITRAQTNNDFRILDEIAPRLEISRQAQSVLPQELHRLIIEDAYPGLLAKSPSLRDFIGCIKNTTQTIIFASQFKPVPAYGLKLSQEKVPQTLLCLEERFQPQVTIGMANQIVGEWDGVMRFYSSRGTIHRDTLVFTVAESLHERIAPKGFYINYYGPPGTVKSYDSGTLLSDSRPDVSFENKVVFVGIGSTNRNLGSFDDRHQTPFSRGTRVSSSGVEIQATAYANLVQDEFVRPQAPVLDAFLTLVIGLFLGVGSFKFDHLFPRGLLLISCGIAALGALTVTFKPTFIWEVLIGAMLFFLIAFIASWRMRSKGLTHNPLSLFLGSAILPSGFLLLATAGSFFAFETGQHFTPWLSVILEMPLAVAVLYLPIKSRKSVFLSYRAIDVPYVSHIERYLTRRGVEVFFDREGREIGDLPIGLLREIERRDIFALIVTSALWGSVNAEIRMDGTDWVVEEIARALSLNQKVILPVYVDGVQKDMEFSKLLGHKSAPQTGIHTPLCFKLSVILNSVFPVDYHSGELSASLRRIYRKLS